MSVQTFVECVYSLKELEYSAIVIKDVQIQIHMVLEYPCTFEIAQNSEQLKRLNFDKEISTREDIRFLSI